MKQAGGWLRRCGVAVCQGGPLDKSLRSKHQHCCRPPCVLGVMPLSVVSNSSTTCAVVFFRFLSVHVGSEYNIGLEFQSFSGASHQHTLTRGGNVNQPQTGSLKGIRDSD